MDEQELKKIMQGMEVPPADENAKKRALNLAMDEFSAIQAGASHSHQNSSKNRNHADKHRHHIDRWYMRYCLGIVGCSYKP